MRNVQLLTNAEIRATGVRAGKATVTDLRTMTEYNIFWGGAPQTHTDFSPFTLRDTNIMRGITNGWTWSVRPVVCSIGGLNLAAGIHHFPHGSIIGGSPGLPNMSNVRPVGGWPVGGHMCMYFRDSTGGTPGAREMATEAFRLASAMEAEMETEEEMRHTTTATMPDWMAERIQILIDSGDLSGTGEMENGLPVINLTDDMARVLIITRNMINNSRN